MTFLDIMSLVGALVVILLALILTYYASRWYAKRIGGSGNRGRYVKIIERLPLAQGSSVFVIKAGGRYYMLGVADKNVSMLGELAELEEDGGQPASGTSFSQILRGTMKGHEGSGDSQ